MEFFLLNYSRQYNMFCVVMSVEDFKAWAANSLTFREERNGYHVPNVYSAVGDIVT
jgi:hypothetical protein